MMIVALTVSLVVFLILSGSVYVIGFRRGRVFTQLEIINCIEQHVHTTEALALKKAIIEVLRH